MSLQHERELPSQVECVLHTAVHPLAAGRRMHVRGIASQKHVALTEGVGQAHPGLPPRMPHHIAHGDAVEMPFEQTHECLLRRERGVRGFTAIAQEQPEVTAGQRRHHQEVIGADAVVKVVLPVGEAVQMDIEVLEEAAGVVLPFDRHPEAAAHARVDAVGRDQIPAANELLLVASIAVRDPRGDAAASCVRSWNVVLYSMSCRSATCV